MADQRITGIATEAAAPADDDFMELDGAVNGSRKLRVARLLAALRNALAPRGGVAFDGTNSARVRSTLTGQNIGTDPFSLVVTFTLPKTIGSNFPTVVALTESTNGALASGLIVWLSSSGQIQVWHQAATGYLDRRSWQFDASAHLGKTVQLAWVRPASGNPVVFLNAVDATAAGSFGGAGSMPSWQSSITSTYFCVGHSTSGDVLAGVVHSASFYNCSLTSADVQEIYELGGAVPERFKWGSQTLLNTQAFNTGGLATVSDATSWSGTGTAGVYANTKSQPVFGAARDKRFRVKFSTATPIANTTTAEGFRLEMRDGAVNGTTRGVTWSSSAGTVSGSILYITASGSYVAEATLTESLASDGRFQFGTQSSAAPSLSISGFSATPIGAVVHLPLDDGGGFQLQDISTNRLHALMTTTGVSHVAPLYGPFRARFTSNTNGNQQLGGQAVIPANSQLLRVRARSRTGTPTVTLGTASGGSQVVASVGLTTAWQTLTIALTGGQVGASNISLWAGSNSTDVIEWDITWEPLSN